jgi:hypothetical protein
MDGGIRVDDIVVVAATASGWIVSIHDTPTNQEP